MARKEKTPSQAPEKGPQPEIKPLGVTAGEVRTAWTITRHRGADELVEDLEKRGLIMVHISREEAAASYRARDYAKSIKRQNRALKEGFAVVDSRGNVTRIDQRATGDLWAEIEKRLSLINRDELLSVAQAREVQRDARKIEFAERKQAERDAARPIRVQSTICPKSYVKGRPTSHSNCRPKPTHPDLSRHWKAQHLHCRKRGVCASPGTAHDYPSTG